jgi:hypothetical protein
MRRFHPLAATAFAAVLALSLGTGCKSKEEPVEDAPDLVEESARELEAARDSGEDTGPAATVDVLLTDRAVEIVGTLAPGRTIFRVHNGGTEKHDFALDGPQGTLRLEDPLKPEESATLEVVLPTGSYVVFCPVPGHRAGLPQQLVVSDRLSRPR